MTTKSSKIKSWLIGATILVALIVGYNTYESSMRRRGHLALHDFQLLAAFVQSEAQRILSESTGTPAEAVVVAGSSSGQAMADADLDYKWEICTSDKKVANTDLELLKRKIEAKLSQTVEGECGILRWYYPKVRLTTSVAIVDSSFFHQPSILVLLKCDN